MSDWSLARSGLTRSQVKLFDLLSDGANHTRADCLGALGKRVASDNLIRVHILRLRRKIEPHGYTIHSKRGIQSDGYRLELAKAGAVTP